MATVDGSTPAMLLPLVAEVASVDDVPKSSPKSKLTKSFIIASRAPDLTIKCQNRTWFAHKSVLSAASDFFAGALRHDFKEAKSSTIEMHDEELDSLDAMFEEIYVAHNRDFTCYLKTPPYQRFLIADEYQVHKMRERALSDIKLLSTADMIKFKETCSEVFGDEENKAGNKAVRQALASSASEHAGDITENAFWQQSRGDRTVDEFLRDSFSDIPEILGAIYAGLSNGKSLDRDAILQLQEELTKVKAQLTEARNECVELKEVLGHASGQLGVLKKKIRKIVN